MNWIMKPILFAISVLTFTQLAAAISAPFRVVDSMTGGFSYSYGPSIIQADGTYYAYFCTKGTGGQDWDHIRVSSSTDLINWTKPFDIMRSTPVERANCDPSVIRYNAGDGDYYYMVYSGNAVNVQTLNFVARSTSPIGPFMKYTDRGTWEFQPRDPHAIIWPQVRAAENSGIYGAGQPSLVVRNGMVYQWYNDSTVNGHSQIFLVTSQNMVNWSSKVSTQIIDHASIDVKFDPKRNLFVMYSIENEHGANTLLVTFESTDGINWSNRQVICDENCFPDWSNNVGVSSSDQGHLQEETLVAFGAPVGLSSRYKSNDCKASPEPYCWGYWDLYGLLLTSKASAIGPTYKLIDAASNDSLWPAANAIDGDTSTAYTSNMFASSINNRGVYLAAWIGSLQNVSKVYLMARKSVQNSIVSFPLSYVIYVTTPDNSKWMPVGTFSTTPDANGVATVELGATYPTYGVLVLPTVLGVDDYGNHFFQLSEIKLGP